MIGEKLRELRHLREMTIEDLASASGLTVGAISHIELGRRLDPKVSTVCALARGLRVQPSRLLEEEPR